MRKLLAIAIAATALWAGYWWIGAWAIEKAVTQAFAAEAAEGLVARNSGIAVNGLPNRFDLKVSGIDLADPVAGWGWKSPFAQVYAMTWQPWYLLAALPSDQVITLPDQTLTLQSEPTVASLLLHPDADLGLNEIVVELQAATLTSDAGWQVGLQKAVASLRQDAAPVNSYRLGLESTNIAVDPALMHALAETDLPATMAEIYFDAHASLSAPLDRHAGDTRPKLTGLTLTTARITWGALGFTADGTLTAGKDGLAEGEIAITLKGWQRLPNVLVAMGAVKADMVPTVTRALQVMAAQSPDPDVLTTKLHCKAGWMYLGPLPLGPAPQLG